MTPHPRRVLFVCTGNTCRSPMAEHLFRRLLRDAGIGGIDVRSAGLAPSPGTPATDQAVAALARAGIRGVRHSAVALDDGMIDAADLILTMERRHREAILARRPDASDRTKVLKIFAGTAEGRDGIADPFGGDDAGYAVAFAEIKAALEAIIRQWSPVDPRGRAGT